MRYPKVAWVSKNDDDPVTLCSECDSGGSVPGGKPVPATSEIAANPAFEPEEIAQAAFERVWLTARMGLAAE
jgi:hypothetical protein